MSLGDRLKVILNKLELSQTNLAKMIGTSNVVINRYIKNKTTPDYSFLKRINSIYNVNINWLLIRFSLKLEKTDTLYPI